MKQIIELSYVEYMSPGTQREHRLIEASEKAIDDVRKYIEHMNRTWSGGIYSKEIKVLSREEAIAFLNSPDIDPGCVEYAKKELGL